MKKPVLNLKNKEVGNVELDNNIFELKHSQILFTNILDIKMQNQDKVRIKLKQDLK